jgi:hypothetical protein
MALTDVEKLIRKRVFVECKDDATYLGTLECIMARSLVLGNWVKVEEHTDTHIILYSDDSEVFCSWNGRLYIGTVDPFRELIRIEENTRKGDPNG